MDHTKEVEHRIKRLIGGTVTDGDSVSWYRGDLLVFMHGLWYKFKKKVLSKWLDIRIFFLKRQVDRDWDRIWESARTPVVTMHLDIESVSNTPVCGNVSFFGVLNPWDRVHIEGITFVVTECRDGRGFMLPRDYRTTPVKLKKHHNLVMVGSNLGPTEMGYDYYTDLT